MRHLGLLPWVGIIKPTDKIPIGSYIEDIEEMHRKTIDPVTGRMFLKHSLMDDMRERQKRVYDSYARKYSDMEGAKEFDENNRFKFNQAQDRVIREMGIDVDKMYPNRKQKEWFAAQSYLVAGENIVIPNIVSICLFCLMFNYVLIRNLMMRRTQALVKLKTLTQRLRLSLPTRMSAKLLLTLSSTKTQQPWELT